MDRERNRSGTKVLIVDATFMSPRRLLDGSRVRIKERPLVSSNFRRSGRAEDDTEERFERRARNDQCTCSVSDALANRLTLIRADRNRSGVSLASWFLGRISYRETLLSGQLRWSMRFIAGSVITLAK